MKILAISDVESKLLWDHFDPQYLEDVDLILSCGDLRASYLSFLATLGHAPVLYVHGNHDTDYERRPPEGCICIEDQVYNYFGLRIAGLGGSMRYKPGPYQYKEKEMAMRALRMNLRVKFAGGVDILVTHAPAFGCNDGQDLPHRGFQCFNQLIEACKPKIFLHGHVHMNYGSYPRLCQHGQTQVINAYEKYLFDIEVPDAPEKFIGRRMPDSNAARQFWHGK